MKQILSDEETEEFVNKNSEMALIFGGLRIVMYLLYMLFFINLVGLVLWFNTIWLFFSIVTAFIAISVHIGLTRFIRSQVRKFKRKKDRDTLRK